MGLLRKDGKGRNLETEKSLKKDEMYGLQKDSTELQKKSLKLQRKQEEKNEKLSRQQAEEKEFLEDQQAHGSLGAELEDGAIAAGQNLGLSVKTTTGFAMGAQDAKMNLFASNEDIVEYYKNYSANREKKQQQVASVYSRELSQDQMDEKLTLSEKQAEATHKLAEKKLKNTSEIERINYTTQAKERVQKAKNELSLPDIVSGIVKSEFTLD